MLFNHLISFIILTCRQMRVKPAELSNKTSFWQDRHTKFQSDEGSASDVDDYDETYTKRKVLICLCHNV